MHLSSRIGLVSALVLLCLTTSPLSAALASSQERPQAKRVWASNGMLSRSVCPPPTHPEESPAVAAANCAPTAFDAAHGMLAGLTAGAAPAADPFDGLTVADYLHAATAVQHVVHPKLLSHVTTVYADAVRTGAAAVRSAASPPQHEVEECLAFLFHFMPASDKPLLLVTFIAETVGLALAARHNTPWGRAVPWPVFLNNVLPYSSLTEPRERWRPLFYTYYSSIPALMNQTDLAGAETWMNTFGWNIRTPRIVFKADPNPVGVWDYDPFSVLLNGYASCTGLSIFLVSALRSMGLPARVAGTPHWNLGPSVCPQGDQSPDCGNHDWVEAWAHDGWAFIDEAGNTVLNTSWFVPDWSRHQSVGGLNHSIFAASWANSSYVLEAYGGDSDPLALPYAYFPMVWNWSIKGPNSGWDVTSRYLLFS